MKGEDIMNKPLAATDFPRTMGQGVLGNVIPAYAALLSQQGYTQQSSRLQIRFLADMNRWLEQQGIQLRDLTEPTIQRYMRSRHQRFRPRRDDASTLKRLLDLLDSQGLLPKQVSATPDNPHDRIEHDFNRYLSEERSLSMSTRINYCFFVRRFLSAQFSDKPVSFTDVSAENVITFVQDQAPCLSPKRAGLMTTALRSFFRYLRHRGNITTDLAACIPAIANWRFSTLPNYLQPHQVQQILRQCDRRTPKGRRDYAILLLLARLGLRACEIVGLTLEDIHWQAGEIAIHGKGNQSARLPLPPDVGQAIADYLSRDRPPCSTRQVFIRMRAPRRGFANSLAICTIVARTLKKARIDSPHMGAHLFRHTLATEMLRKGSSLAEIALLLRHRSLNTTTIYAKVDLQALRALALPWPGGDL
jgi:site-specific recombinase XerD